MFIQYFRYQFFDEADFLWNFFNARYFWYFITVCSLDISMLWYSFVIATLTNLRYFKIFDTYGTLLYNLYFKYFKIFYFAILCILWYSFVIVIILIFRYFWHFITICTLDISILLILQYCFVIAKPLLFRFFLTIYTSNISRYYRNIKIFGYFDIVLWLRYFWYFDISESLLFSMIHNNLLSRYPNIFDISILLIL